MPIGAEYRCRPTDEWQQFDSSPDGPACATLRAVNIGLATFQMSENKGQVIRINDFGLCEVAAGGKRFAFTLDKLPDYAGQPLRDLGLQIGAEVVFESDERGRVASAHLAHAAAAGS